MENNKKQLEQYIYDVLTNLLENKLISFKLTMLKTLDYTFKKKIVKYISTTLNFEKLSILANSINNKNYNGLL
jgi:hypothetical protein